jgi:hypothetical protein
VVERLANVVEPAYVPVWMHKPVGALDDRKPLDLIRVGKYRPVLQTVSALEGMPVS